MKIPDERLLELLKRGDEVAYKYIYDLHYHVLCKFANEFLNDPFLAETIVGDTVFHLWEIRDSLEIKTSLISYLIKAVRNRCINHLNLEYRKREINLSTFLPDNHQVSKYIISEDCPLGLLLERELEREINDSIENLPEECRRVFKKSRFEGQSYEEIASELDISVNTVKYHMKNALSRLQTNLRKYLLFFLFFV